jgi:hypothetical protein
MIRFGGIEWGDGNIREVKGEPESVRSVYSFVEDRFYRVFSAELLGLVISTWTWTLCLFFLSVSSISASSSVPLLSV